MKKAKLYTSEAWLRRKLYREQKTPEQIASECGASVATIYNWINKFGLKI